MRARLSSRVSLAAFLLLSGAAQALTPSEPSKKERLAALPEEERKWLTEYVAPIILPEEEKLYLQLTEPHQREIFKEEFWKRREKDGLTPPLGPGYRQRYENLRNLAATVYEGLQSDAGRMVVRYGEPASVVEFVNCSEVFRQVEVWTYPRSSFNSRQDVQHLFYRPSFGGPRKLWSPITPEREVLQPASCLTSFQDVCVAEANPGVPLPSEDPSCVVARPRSCGGGCRIAQIAEEIRSRQAGSAAELASLFRSPAVLTEDLEKLRARFATISDPKAKPVSVQSPPELLKTARQDPPEPSRKERLAALPEEERKWLTEFIAPIILPEEEKLFLELTEPHEREIFKEEFWKRREKDGLTPPLGPGYRQRYEELRRLAEQTYDGWLQDAGRMVIRFGEPASIERLEACRDTFRDLEIWTYRTAVQAGKGILRHFFYRPYPASARKLWTLNVSESEIFTPNACRRNFDELGIFDCTTPVSGRGGEADAEQQAQDFDNCTSQRGQRARICAEACGVFQAYTEIKSRQGSRAGGDAERAQLTQKPPLSTEGLWERFPYLGEAGAKKVSVQGPSGFTTTSTGKGTSEPSKKERLAALPEEERKWLTEYVAPIILLEEEKLFLQLTEPHQREIFKEEFWKRREVTDLLAPLGPGYRHRYEELRRLADEKYDGWKQDAGRMVIRFGEPASIEETDVCGDTFRGVEIWTYNNLGASGRGITRYVFYRRFLAGPRKLWDLSVPESELFTPAPTTPKSLIALAGNCRLSPGGFNPQEKDRISAASPEECRCHIYLATEEVRARQGSPAGAVIEAARLREPPAVSTEGLDRLRGRFATIADAKAKPLSVEGPSSGFVQTSTKPVPSELSGKERLAALPEEERKWLTEFVAPIILPEEEKLFLQLTEPHQREIFKEEFWKRREKDGLTPPLGPGYRHRYEELRRLADEKYDGWKQDAGRMVIRWGEPDEIEEPAACDDYARDVEFWTYSHISAGGHHSGRYLFYRPTGGASPRRLWHAGLNDSDLYTHKVDPSILTTQRLAEECGKIGMSLPTMLQTPLPGLGCFCKLFEHIQQTRALSGRASAATEVACLLGPPPISTEGLDQLKDRLPSLPDTKAKSLTVEGPSRSTTAVATALPEDERKWLKEYVAPIILPQEEKLFLKLTEPHQREIFKEEFWKRREKPGLPPPLGPGYRHRYEEFRKLADDKYDGWREDAGRMVTIHGEPTSIKEVKGCQETFRDLEIWTYANRGGSGRITDVYFFYRPMLLAPRKLWNLSVPESDVFVPNSCRKTFESLYLDCHPDGRDRCLPCPEQLCEVYEASQQIKLRQGSPAGAQIETAKLLDPPRVDIEDLDQIADRFPGLADPKAKPLSVEGPSSAAAAAASSAAKAPPKASTPAPARRKLSGKEIRELTARLEQKYRDWLQLVELIVTDEERQVFLQIADNYQKDRFIETFWRRRSIDSQGLRTDYQAIHTRRVETAKELFKNLNNDRAKILIINGAPDAMIPIDCQDVYVPIQIWYYDRLESLKSKVYLIFYQPYGVGEYKLWLPLDGEGVLQVGGGLGPMRPGRGRSRVETCMEERTLRQAIGYSTAVLGSGAMALAGAGKLFQPPIVETEGVDQILSMTTELAAGSVPLGLTKLLRFPEQRANKIAVDLSLLIPKSDLAPRELGEEKFYNVDVIGEVVKGERLIDNFKYRFDVPTDEIGSDKIPLTVRRYLYPGEYNLVLKVSDGNQNAEGRISEKLTVPEQPDAPPPLVAAAREEARATVEKAKETGLLPSAISLLPIAKEIATGLQRFETKVAEGIRAVDFYLNGAKVMTKTRPPFDADLNLGPLPRRHTIRVVAYGPAGRAVGEDEYIVNEGREVFRVRILSPEKGSRVSGPTKVVAAVAVPEGKALQKLEFYSNESRAATLYQPPFEQTVNIRSSKSLGYVRVVGTLEDGTVSEDVRYVNAPDYISEVTVDAVELYTTVTEKGRPVAGLQASNFKVYEDGVLQRVESFEYVKNLPLSLGVVVDTSASMLESLPEAQQAALAFLDFSIGPKDRAFTVSFDNEPYLLSKPTNRKDKLFRSLAGMRAEGSTALYDAIIYALYQFTGVKGKKALVLLSDGKDTASKFDFETTLEYVRKAGISIYGIGLKISGADLEVKYKLNKLAQVTGGQTFYVDSAKNLESVYRQINEDLRSQYLLTYYSTNTGGKDKWRKVEVKVEPANLQARTLSGYYP